VKRYAAVAAALGLLAAAAPVMAAGVGGLWSGEAQVKGVAVPFRLELKETAGRTVSAHFFDGARVTTPSAPATLQGGQVHLVFPSYASTLDLSEKGDALDGVYVKPHNAPIPVHLVRAGPQPAASGAAPAIAGEWIVPLRSAKGEQAWRLIVHQHGAEAQATILRVDGDTGTLDGRYVNGAFRLSHFAGERPALLQVSPAANGELKLVLDDADGHQDLTALRPKAAAAQGVAPADPTRFTGVQDAQAPFAFAFPDLAGHRVANTDRRFRGKVVIVDVMGSWCPNCHDETPFLEALYRKHHAQGLEVVALDFEQPDQLSDPQRLHAFIQRYGVTYTVLLCGQPKEVHDKLPQATNLAAWPTTFFLGRDGRVKEVHVGFTSPGSGQRDVETKAAVEKEVDALLAERAPKT
jgi:thiol-disulfide isomerase/thioredoxin